MTYSPKSQDERPHYIPELDGLRAFAVLGVLVAHSFDFTRIGWMIQLSPYGATGVDLFFVLSGFLITGILLDGKDSPHALRNFYVRRALRIWPLYYALLALLYIGFPLLNRFTSLPSEFRFPQSVYPWTHYAFYLQNALIHDFGPAPLAVTWSLAIEEHFYLLWPLVVMRAPRRYLKYILLAMILGSPLLRFASLQFLDASKFFAYVFTLCRLDGLAVGALLALAMREREIPKLRLAHWGRMAFGAGAATALGLIVLRLPAAIHLSLWYLALAIGFGGALALALSLAGEGKPAARLLRQPWLTHIGKISYGLYISHQVVFFFFWGSALQLWITKSVGNYILADLLKLAVAYAAAFAVANLSWYWFESPILRFKERFAGGRKDESRAATA